MPWRFIGFIILCGVLLAFIGFNLENRCTVSFGFTEIRDAPVYLTAFAGFVLGMLCAIPFIFSLRRKKALPKGAEASPPGKKKWGKPKAGPPSIGSNGDSASNGSGAPYGSDGSYGVD
jgi:hypothetical protein